MQLHDLTNTLRFGTPLARATGVVILLHGRGSSAEDIAGLSEVFPPGNIAFVAPSATRGTWYPQRFFVPLPQNEPWLSSALGLIEQLVNEANAAGIDYNRIAFLGFSQGACLALEYAVRNPRRYGFVAGLSGALIGPIDTPRSPVTLDATPLLLGCAESDAHIPLEYVEKSAEVLSRFAADVTKQIYPGSAHTVFPQEIAWLKAQAQKIATR